MKPQRRKFKLSELTPLKGVFVVLGSGGPLMRVECMEGENAVCSWADGEKTERQLFPLVMLRRLERFSKDWLEKSMEASQ